MSDIVLSLLVLGALAMLGGGWIAWKKGDRKRAVLMVIAAAVMALNVAIWTIPTPEDTSLTEAAREAD
ncbi:hypothetical protein [Croceicoccus bisphenolivorans]|uniref:hypothetical protein n=1 Tax=Croceicoccus bisphenolivorans TaxID=1783232 RepID=UPI0008378EFB|nr:hypothetical protein [Croceicoccus bisphenolivorans]